MIWAEIKKALNSTVGTENFKPLDEIIASLVVDRETESRIVALDFSEGNIHIIPSEGKTISSVEILKPAQLESSNIKAGIEIAGIIGDQTTAFCFNLNARNSSNPILLADDLSETPHLSLKPKAFKSIWSPNKWIYVYASEADEIHSVGGTITDEGTQNLEGLTYYIYKVLMNEGKNEATITIRETETE